jgi:hypothetical protein
VTHRQFEAIATHKEPAFLNSKNAKGAGEQGAALDAATLGKVWSAWQRLILRHESSR